MSRPTTSTVPETAPVLGPCPCSDCHLPLFFMPSGQWSERHWERDGWTGETVALFKIHVCTAAAPAAVPFLTLEMMA